MPTDAAVTQHDETSRLLSQTEDVSSYGINSNADSECPAEPVASHEVKTASYLAYVRTSFMLS